MTTLFVAALAEEAAALPGHADFLEVGLGKVSAATTLSSHLRGHPDVDLVVNFGTAGGLRHQPTGSVVDVGRVLQHDLDVDALSALVGRELPGGPLDVGGGSAVLATGDRFVSDPADRAELARRAHVVDMEGYALVAAARANGVDIRVVKCVSDGADGDAATTWQQTVVRSSHALVDHLSTTGLLP